MREGGRGGGCCRESPRRIGGPGRGGERTHSGGDRTQLGRRRRGRRNRGRGGREGGRLDLVLVGRTGSRGELGKEERREEGGEEQRQSPVRRMMDH